MHHARHLDVGDVVLFAIDFRGDVLARDLLADDLVLARLLRHRLAGRVERVAVLLVPLELGVEVAPADQVGIGFRARGVVRGILEADDAVDDDQSVGLDAEFLRRHLDEDAARLGGGGAHLLAAVLDAGRAGGAALVHAGAGVAHDDLDALERHVELFGDHLADGREQALPHIHLAEERRHGAVRVDGDVGIELARHERRARSLRGGRLDGENGVEADRHADRDHEGAAGLEEGAARERRRLVHLGHARLPQPIISDARFMARMMPICVPQRHLRPVSASLISSSVGRFLSARNAAPVMIQPLMQ